MKAAFFVFLLTVILSPSLLAAESPNGKQLYDKNCMGCHDTRIHTRPNRIVHVYSDLANRVKFCDAQVQSNFSNDQLNAVTDYLNDSFYKFVKD